MNTKTFTGDKVPRLTKYVYPFSGIFRDAAYTLVSLFLMIYVQFTLGKEGGYQEKMLVITIIMIITRIWDGVNDPMMGSIIENARFKMGKYKPWILIGAVSNALILALMFTVRPGGWWFVALFGVFYLLWEMTFTMNDIAYWSMLPSLSKNEKTRNQLTTYVALAASIGAFAVGGLLPTIYPGQASSAFFWAGIVIAALFLASQLLLVFTCKERAREDENEEKTSLKTMFTTIFKNKQLWVMMFVITFYYLGSALLNAFGLNYFIFAYGYQIGGANMFLFTVAYAVGTIIPQALYALIAKRFTRSQILNASFITMIVGYLIIFSYGMLHAFNVLADLNIYLLSGIGVFVFAAQGLFYMVLLVMVTNTIEYNQWTTGERKESVIFAARPFAAKMSSSLQTLIVFLILTIGGIYAITGDISQLEIDKELGTYTSAEVITLADAAIANAGNPQLVLTAILFGMTILPVLLFIVSYVLIRKKFFITEKAYAQICLDIEQGNIGNHTLEELKQIA
jgi:melibiose permease/lactose/raffinose/galactose permease